jgi:predicted enzyme related to lactoylglutathione lyase
VSYKVIGIGAGDAELVYEEETLIEAARLTHKMTDFGVRSAHIFDPQGNEIALEEAYRIAGLTT